MLTSYLANCCLCSRMLIPVTPYIFVDWCPSVYMCCADAAVFCIDLTTLELLRRDVKVISNGAFSIAVSAVITEMQVCYFSLTNMWYYI